MASKKKKGKTVSNVDTGSQITEYIVSFSAMLMCILIPLIMRDGYDHISDIKFTAYKWICILGFDLAAIAGIVSFWLSAEKGSFKEAIKRDRILYIFIFLFLFSNILGTIFSVDKRICINGVPGWNMGLLSQISFVIILLIFKSFSRFGKAIIGTLISVAFIVYVLGIVNRYGIDPLDVYRIGTIQEMPPHYKLMFLSSVGQATWYSSFVSVTLSLVTAMYLKIKNSRLRMGLCVYLLTGFMTLVSQNSDSMYMAFAGFMLVAFGFACSDKVMFERFLEEIVMFFVASRLIKLGYLITGYSELRYDKISEFLINGSLMWVFTILSIVIWACYFFFIYKKKFNEKLFGTFRKIVFGITGALICIAVFILVLDGNGMLSAGITDITHRIPYLKWSEFWGSGRGKTWTFSVKMFREMDIVHKLIGLGPDGYFAYAYTYYAEELNILWPQDTMTNAHNEFLNALINNGIIGVISYIGMFGYVVKKLLKNKESFYCIMGLSAIIGYICHNFFCYQQVCCTPFIFMVMGISIYDLNTK